MTSNHETRVQRLERKAKGTAQLLANPPPTLEVFYQAACDGAPAGEAEFAYSADPLAGLKRRLQATIAKGTPTT